MLLITQNGKEKGKIDIIQGSVLPWQQHFSAIFTMQEMKY